MHRRARGRQVRDGEAPAYFNAVEAAVLADLVSGLLERASGGVAANDLGVIATYRKQARRAAEQKERRKTRGSAACAANLACLKSHSGEVSIQWLVCTWVMPGAASAPARRHRAAPPRACVGAGA